MCLQERPAIVIFLVSFCLMICLTSSLLHAITVVTNPKKKKRRPAPLLFRYSMDEEVINHNTVLLMSYDHNFAKIIKQKQNTALCYGSEFCSIKNFKSIY